MEGIGQEIIWWMERNTQLSILIFLSLVLLLGVVIGIGMAANIYTTEITQLLEDSSNNGSVIVFNHHNYVVSSTNITTSTASQYDYLCK